MADEGFDLTEKRLKELEKKIAAEYRQATKDVTKKLNDYLKKFYAEDAKLRQQVKDGTLSKQDYQDWVKRHVAMGERWRAVRDSLAEDYHNTNVIAQKIVFDYQKDVYALNRNFATYQVEHDAKVQIAYTLYDRDTVERILEDEPDLFHAPGKKRAAEIAANKDLRWNKRQVNSVILQGILQGMSIPELAGRLESVTERNHVAAVRNARTAITGAQNAGRVDGYKNAEEQGIDLMQEWMATLDGRTRHSHRMLHGERIKVGGVFSNRCRYPGDPSGAPEEVYNCRCTLIAQIQGYETSRITSSPKMGGMSFSEWQKQGS